MQHVQNILSDIRSSVPRITRIHKALHEQEAMGGELTLDGYLLHKGIRVMKYFCKDKPKQKISHMIQGLWQIMFSAAWEKKKSITHSDKNIVDSKLREWKRRGCSSLMPARLPAMIDIQRGGTMYHINIMWNS